MSKIIIGIHGMGNKPSKEKLSVWWKAPIREGLKKINKPKQFFNLELFYWAHYLYPVALKPGIKDKENPLYIEDPYFHAPKNVVEEKPSYLRKKILTYLETQLDKIFVNEDLSINYASITDFIIHHFFRDLETYYNDFCVKQINRDSRAKEVICSNLADILFKHRRKKILLIAHSMGSIIAYDVLTQYVPEVPVDTFVTIGSPLGLPIIKSKIVAEHKNKNSQDVDLKTPENVLSYWYNLSDLKDKIAFNFNLSDDFKANTRNVCPVDKIVYNDYEFMGKKNAHKSYGYLRTREMAQIIADFLGETHYSPFSWIKKILGQ